MMAYPRVGEAIKENLDVSYSTLEPEASSVQRLHAKLHLPVQAQPPHRAHYPMG